MRNSNVYIILSFLFFMAKKITVRFMLQIAGKPVENVEKALDIVFNKIRDSKDWKFLEGEIIEPELDGETTMFSGLIEVLLKFEDAEKVLEFIVDYTPNSIEVEDPEKLEFDIAGFNSILNVISARFLNMSNDLRKAHATSHYLHDKLQKLEAEKKAE